MRAVIYMRKHLPNEAGKEELEQQMETALPYLDGAPPDKVFYETDDGIAELQQAISYAHSKWLPLIVCSAEGTKKPFRTAVAKAPCPFIFPQIGGWDAEPVGASRRMLSLLREWQEGSSAAALAAKQDKRLFNGGYVIRPEHAEMGRDERSRQALELAVDRGAEVQAAYSEAKSYSGAAKLLESRGVPTVTGKGTWHPQAV